MTDLDKETVDFTPNYDETTEEPTVLPAPFPNLLVNGSAGIAVGMATNVPPHNLREVIDGCIWLIENTHFADAEPARPLTRAEKLRNLIRLIPGAGLSDRRLHRRPPGRRAGVHDRPRLDHDAREVGDRDEQEGRSPVDRRHRDSVSGEQGEADRADRRPGAREDDRGHLRSARRVRPRRHAHRRSS